MKLKEVLGTIHDPRVEGRTRHKLADIIMLTLIGFICGEQDIESIAEWAVLNQENLKKVIPLDNGIPSADTLLRVMGIIDPKKFEELLISVTRQYFEALPEVAQKEIIAIDGKTIKGSRTKTNSVVHIVSAFATKLQLFLAQVKTNEKSNEITAIPELLDLLDLKNTIITIDAMGCQKDIANKIVEKEADYVLSLKGNHSILLNNIKDFFKLVENPIYYKEYKITKSNLTTEKDHGRVEKRQTFLCTRLEWLEERKDWANLKGIGMTISTRIIDGVSTTEKRYFITTLTDVHETAKAFRQHWQIEQSHWILDVNFREDDTKIRDSIRAQNLSIIRKLALNLFKQFKKNEPGLSKNKSFHKMTLNCIYNPEYLKKVLSYL